MLHHDEYSSMAQRQRQSARTKHHTEYLIASHHFVARPHHAPFPRLCSLIMMSSTNLNCSRVACALTVKIPRGTRKIQSKHLCAGVCICFYHGRMVRRASLRI
ncbi:hypothetical protein BDN70DRAFT_238430 [Pholiota conissans]|uniref:Uncharacterized protein n=1 Tax=Pholiota conissans TaxID=109636 RepID=A0A9P5ZGX6_9AGAR|nr:hypothetical protein BDN70DRAFT_238430 [Pholiota conissans]